MQPLPTQADWAGQTEAFHKLTRLFYKKVPRNPHLAPVFTSMDRRHSEHVAAFIAEVIGAPAHYTSAGGSHAGMICKHMAAI